MTMYKDVAVRSIPVQEMATFVATNHYSTVMPRITKQCFGGFRDERLVAAISFGWGSRPRHTIQKLFPSLNTTDYLEIGKMCLLDSEPRNSESQFMAVAFRKLHNKLPHLKLIFTWADGMWGKPGYVYQAASFLYGGFYLDRCLPNPRWRTHSSITTAGRNAQVRPIYLVPHPPS